KKFLLEIALSLGVILIWNVFLFPPPRPVPARAPATAASPTSGGTDANRPPESKAASSAPLSPAAGAGPSAKTAPAEVERVEAEGEQEKTNETDLYRIRFNNRGARVLSWQLKKWLDDQGKPLELISIGAAKSKRFPLDLEFSDPGLSEK